MCLIYTSLWTVIELFFSIAFGLDCNIFENVVNCMYADDKH